ncbi:mobile element protein [Aquipluma nitroreducens]|uniref:Mobile element protein n=1 Tax=Aquipluma nitroreducens TaxID=2010828 RepID=A0A5K7SDU3_9BACT|nr:IS3 family transposase [Aquipluma nitroreducens]BBE19782.1 mobile element protein [Aquipluma nitroreducens]
MKTNFSHIGLAKLCGWFGLTRQAYYQNGWKGMEVSIEEDILLSEVSKIREGHKRMGTRKLHDKLCKFMIDHQIKMGRDALFDLLSSNHMLVRKRTRRIQTTQSHHWLRKYKNLIRGFVPTGPNQLWVSDITYWKINGIYVYISFITDAFSRKVVGYHVALSLETVETIEALKMALSELILGPNIQLNLIHHSDRGVQYCCNEYVRLLNENHIQISMTENGDPLENAIAERLNGILKDEYLNDSPVKSIYEARLLLAKSVRLYVSIR